MQPALKYDCTPRFVRIANKFTGKERDAESGNDYFDARYYASSMGRFMSPDWSAKEEPVPYAKLDNPQSLNLYAYVLNNPLSNVDTDSHLLSDLQLAAVLQVGGDLPPFSHPFITGVFSVVTCILPRQLAASPDAIYTPGRP
jgi:RHS repeat-associated protein